MKVLQINPDIIRANYKSRPVNKEAVERLAESINRIGLKTPITVRPMLIHTNGVNQDGYQVVSGNHRLEAIRMLGMETIDCFVTEDDEQACQLWEISENLHRAELTTLERDNLVAKWCRLVGEEKMVQVEPFSKVGAGRGNTGGEREAARQLGLPRLDVRRACKVASLTEEAQEKAKDLKLDNNRTALLEAAAQPAEQQADYLEHRAERKREVKLAPDMLDDFEAEERQYAAIVSAWNKAGQAARQRFLREHT